MPDHVDGGAPRRRRRDGAERRGAAVPAGYDVERDPFGEHRYSEWPAATVDSNFDRALPAPSLLADDGDASRVPARGEHVLVGEREVQLNFAAWKADRWGHVEAPPQWRPSCGHGVHGARLPAAPEGPCALAREGVIEHASEVVPG